MTPEHDDYHEFLQTLHRNLMAAAVHVHVLQLLNKQGKDGSAAREQITIELERADKSLAKVDRQRRALYLAGKKSS